MIKIKHLIIAIIIIVLVALFTHFLIAERDYSRQQQVDIQTVYTIQER